MLKYTKLTDKLKQQNINKSALRNMGFSPNLINRLERGEHVNTVNIDKLCTLLNCQPGDIMEWVPDDKED